MIWCGMIPICVCMIKGHSDKMVWIIHSTPLQIARGLYGPNEGHFLVLSPLHLYFCYWLNHHWSPCSDPKESSLNIISPIFNIFLPYPTSTLILSSIHDSLKEPSPKWIIYHPHQRFSKSRQEAGDVPSCKPPWVPFWFGGQRSNGGLFGGCETLYVGVS